MVLRFQCIAAMVSPQRQRSSVLRVTHGKTAKPPRENRTITVDFQDETTYFQLLGDTKAFVEWVLAFILALGFQLKHKRTAAGVDA